MALGTLATGFVGLPCNGALAASEAPPKRPVVRAFHAIDYASLPLLEPALPGAARCARLAFRVGTARSAQARATKPVSPRWFVDGLLAEANVRMGRLHLVDATSLSPRPRFDAATDRAEWMVVDRDALTADVAPVSRCEAGAQLDAYIRAEKLETGTAEALVPGRVYAYRRCVEGCDAPLGSAARVEEVGVVTSPAIWISSSGWGSNGARGKDTFSRGFARVEVGATATIVVGLPPADAAQGLLRSTPTNEGADTFDIEVTWTDGVPELTLFEGHVEGSAAALAVRAPY